MMDTLSGFVKNFMPNGYNKYTSHNQSTHIFRRMIIFYHMALVRNLIEHDGTDEVASNIYFINMH